MPGKGCSCGRDWICEELYVKQNSIRCLGAKAVLLKNYQRLCPTCFIMAETVTKQKLPVLCLLYAIVSDHLHQDISSIVVQYAASPLLIGDCFAFGSAQLITKLVPRDYIPGPREVYCLLYAAKMLSKMELLDLHDIDAVCGKEWTDYLENPRSKKWFNALATPYSSVQPLDAVYIIKDLAMTASVRISLLNMWGVTRKQRKPLQVPPDFQEWGVQFRSEEDRNYYVN